MPATYSRLRDGTWGVRVTGALPAPGNPVDVSKRDGSLKREVIKEVLWQGDGVTLCKIEGQVKPPTAANSHNRRGGPTCAACGRRGALVEDLEDGLLKHYRCCDIPP